MNENNNITILTNYTNLSIVTHLIHYTVLFRGLRRTYITFKLPTYTLYAESVSADLPIFIHIIHTLYTYTQAHRTFNTNRTSFGGGTPSQRNTQVVYLLVCSGSCLCFQSSKSAKKYLN